MSILKLAPACKDYLWGGTKLITDYGKRYDGARLAETWELSGHPDGPSVLASGPDAGKTLADYLAAHPGALGEHGRKFAELPVLIKLIDAAKDLSIQVHPDDAYARAHEGQNGKTEMWYVLSAAPDAFLYCGFSRDISRDELARRIADNTLPEVLRRVNVKAGDTVFIPAGTIHASGHNQVILEIGSLTVGSYTYKLYDYQRIDPQTGLPRPIHLAAGRKVIHPERTAGWVTENLVNHGGVKRQGEGYVERTVGEHELLYFALHTETFDRVITDDTRDRFHVLALTEGEQVRIESQADPARHFVANYLDVIVVPADFGPYRIVNLGQGPVTVHKTCLKDSFETCAR